MNLYGYVGGQPVRKLDPFGTEDESGDDSFHDAERDGMPTVPGEDEIAEEIVGDAIDMIIEGPGNNPPLPRGPDNKCTKLNKDGTLDHSQSVPLGDFVIRKTWIDCKRKDLTQLVIERGEALAWGKDPCEVIRVLCRICVEISICERQGWPMRGAKPIWNTYDRCGGWQSKKPGDLPITYDR